MKIYRAIPRFSVLLIVFMLAAASVSAQDTVTISIDDLKQLRKLAADRDYEKARADEAVKQRDEWQASSGNWRSLYQAEKDRADRVQGGRVIELQKALDAARELNALDKQRIADLEFDNRKLRGRQKWIFGAGFLTGAATGVYGAKKFSF